MLRFSAVQSAVLWFFRVATVEKAAFLPQLRIVGENRYVEFFFSQIRFSRVFGL